MVSIIVQSLSSLRVINHLFREVITKGHPWILYFVVIIAYVSWFSSLLLWAVDIGEYFARLINALRPGAISYSSPDGYDALGFGQVSTTRSSS